MATSVCGQEPNQAENETLRKRHQLQGGFECIFVKDPPEHLQTECSVCLCVLREPYLVDCCGYSFCRSCIETIKSENKPCPLCAVQFTTCIPDKRLQRTLNDFQVYCSHKGNGCEWVGSLGNLTQHLNAKPLSEGERLSGCQLTSVECKHCFDHVPRQDIVKHETMICPQRQHSCEICCSFTSTFEDVTLNHFTICPDRPAPCPNGCGLSPKAKLLEDHLKMDCPLQVIECPFSYAGCTERMTRQSMPEHITQSLSLHMSLQATSHQQELKKLNSRISELEMKLEDANGEVAELRMANQLLLNKLEQECKSQVKIATQDHISAHEQSLKDCLGELREDIKTAQAERKQMKFDIECLHSHVGLVPFTVTMPNFEEKKLYSITWYSPPFYTHPQGYKMCLRVDANGYGDGNASHVSVFVHMMKGDYDNELMWPFRGDITIQILNQAGDDGHRTEILDVTDDGDDDDIGNRVILGAMSNGLGYYKFLSHEDLSPHYLKDDCLCLCVKEVELM